MKSKPFVGQVSESALKEYRDQHGYWPRVVSCNIGVLGVAAKEKDAQLALELARDGALVKQLAEAFGGIRYLDKRSSDFIENWEVEAYRRKQV